MSDFIKEEVEFLQEQIDGIEKAIKEGKIFNTEEVLKERQKKFQSIIDKLKVLSEVKY